MKFLAHGIIALLLFVLVSPAMAAIEIEGDAYVGISSMYLWRGFDLSDSDPVVQGGMDVSFKGFTLSYWSNLDLDSGELNETDYTIDYSFDPSEMVSLSVGNIFYALDGAKDTNEFYLGVSLNTILAPTLTVYYDYDEADEAGMFYTLSIGHDLELAEGLSLSLGGLISYNQESDYAIGNYDDWHNYELSASADYAVTEQISVSPYVIFSDALSDDAEDIAGIEDECVGGLNLTISF
ncbi:TorF family putative porin [Malonomonas rubra]|uniref:TorF family putative porin n=1 Tax=Malonomonas rubra TaxID=57040 RepID=UPI0026EF5FE7|nr:TorF family putative porin [Malonomonas rubra]